jgi:hypothetical protein
LFNIVHQEFEQTMFRTAAYQPNMVIHQQAAGQRLLATWAVAFA